ncbi:MAG: transcription termination factor NusA [Chlamydiae bacterium GWC2_50_10]|nr:MAG: transcription termination factor NusA [Chlamydiae bacterium GWA2_50_15]OGN54308.1 MAG: transcription termination factor NusA [Chlamydiae bacterium GWF2_49_8]OGN54592.1 MAG: transcription termination factor NusA [Chlamydiae bacterium GWC2_50_10]OGN57872.1 MAG: transcription termination factor NusA [Chlamydiae bacterium RIFCSPHIGHO2_02_FULL_49_29]OGN63340.1 MAG: transcription termination factor NusA [Chlamydiae bacterium RIFCSPHIGHO2_12_FULL_49_32]OGN69667.1 MAG: transcription terminatio
MNKELISIFEYLEREKGIKRDVIIGAITDALLSAAHKSTAGLINVSVTIDSKTGKIDVIAQKEVVDQVTIPEEEIALEEARVIDPHCQLGTWVNITVTPHDFGRIAAQTARQIISQKLRSAERDVIYEEYRHRLHEIVSGTVKRVVRGATLIVDLGKVEAILPDRFYPKTENYYIGDRVQALLYEVRDTESGGAEVVLSRSSPAFASQLFMQEVPELSEGVVTIEKIVRDAGYRTKLAVSSSDSKIDPVGACVGVRGTRVKNVIRELNNEKIDIFPFSDDPVQLLQNALSPIEIRKISVAEDHSTISIVVNDDDYPAVLGKRGMNARLNGQLIGAELDVQRMTDYQKVMSIQRAEMAASEDATLDEPLKIEGMSSFVLESFLSAGYDTARKILNATPEELSKIPDISPELADTVLEKVKMRNLKHQE